ncbi:unnamed protein product (macronuclear) [Paramecium tetraurelia]|uniref:Uncharacterized protein n=1 Tax=Paramecium tetraurelia TaxID=5888 RepID=A0CDJ9_PARTE|nr:uncharacterized protein GSPATT00007077001 [Paramecium tetraurelia]CAK68866.1 unnamed protein product [Paramecium tetraurelia]|eukprot:XP_001436263.1 hypothetical protein (macronuclear) [Paramecium tetraurelia strain d4-2]
MDTRQFEQKPSVQSYSSFDSYVIQDEHDGNLSIHQLKEKPFFSFQEAKDQNAEANLNTNGKNNQHKQKQPYETVQDLLYTEEKLELPSQQLKQIPKLQQNFVNIKLLNLSQNQLTTVPPQIMRMTNLQKLILSSNQINVLPIFLQTLKYLEYLDMQDNLVKVFNINPPELKYLNLSNNYIEQLYFPNLEHLCIQMNCFTVVPKGFHKVLYGMQYFEFDWFKYCKPALPMKINFEKYQHIKDKLISMLQSTSLTFETFVKLLSISEPNFYQTDYKYRNLFFSAGSSNEIGILYSLIQIIPEQINNLDFDQNTPLSACYNEGKARSVKVLRSLGGKFAPQSIHVICQRVDLAFFKILLNLNEEDNSTTHHTDLNLIHFRNVDGNTPLHQLFMNYSKSPDAKVMADVLLSLGADPNGENNEGWTPLDLAVRKGQINSIQYAVEYNKRLFQLRSHQQLFDFQKKSGQSEWSLGHVAASVGNIDILELLSQINIDIFQVSKCNRLPRHLAIQSLTMLKNMRKLEKRWIIKRVLHDSVSVSQTEKNVYQMKNQIEKNMTKKHQNIAQKLIENEDDNIDIDFDIEDNSFRIASESSIKDVVTESAPIFQRLANKEVTRMQLEKQNMSTLDTTDFADHLPEIQKLLRNHNYEVALQKLKYALLSDMLPLSERLKYKDYIQMIQFKMKYSKVEMQSYLRSSLNLTLSEFQFKGIPLDQKSKLIKELVSLNKDQSRNEASKIQFHIEKMQLVCQNPLLHQDLLAKDLATINELRQKLSNNLIYDIANYAESIYQLNDQIYYWINTNHGRCEKLLIKSNIPNLVNYECLQKMRFVKKAKSRDKDYDNIEQDMIEPESSISSYQQFTYIITPFQNSKRF